MSVEQVRSQVATARSQLEQAKKQAETTRKELLTAKERLPDIRGEKSLRETFKGLTGRQQVRQVAGVEKEIGSRLGEVRRYEEQTIKPFESQVESAEAGLKDYDARMRAIKQVESAARKGKVYLLAGFGSGYVKEYAKKYLEQENLAEEGFVRQVSEIQKDLPTGEKLIVDYEKREIKGVSSEALQQSLPVIDGQIRFGSKDVSSLNIKSPEIRAPVGEINIAPSLPSRLKTEFKTRLSQSGNVVSATLGTASAFFKSRVDKEAQRTGDYYQLEAKKNIVGLGTEVAPYFTPAGPLLLATGGTSKIVAYQFRPEILERKGESVQSFLQEKTGVKVSGATGRGLVMLGDVAEVGLGAFGLKQQLGRQTLPDRIKIEPPKRIIEPPKRTLRTEKTIGKDTGRKIVFPEQKISQVGIAGSRQPTSRVWRDIVRSGAERLGFKPSKDFLTVYKGVPRAQPSIYKRELNLLQKTFDVSESTARGILRYRAPVVTETGFRGVIRFTKAGSKGVFELSTKQPRVAVDKDLGIFTRKGKTVKELVVAERQIVPGKTISFTSDKGLTILDKNKLSFALESSIRTTEKGGKILGSTQSGGLLIGAESPERLVKGGLFQSDKGVTFVKDFKISEAKGVGLKTPIRSTFPVKQKTSIDYSESILIKAPKKTSTVSIGDTTKSTVSIGDTTKSTRTITETKLLTQTPTVIQPVKTTSFKTQTLTAKKTTTPFIPVTETKRITETRLDIKTDTKTANILDTQQAEIQTFKPLSIDSTKQDKITTSLSIDLQGLSESQKKAQKPLSEVKSESITLKGLKSTFVTPTKTASITTTTKTTSEPKPKKDKRIIGFGLSKAISKLKESKSSPSFFEAFGRRKGKDISLGKFRGQEEAERKLKGFLTGTLGASGKIKTNGKELQFKELSFARSPMFRVSKAEKTRVVQKREFRLGTFGEKLEIKRSKGGFFR